MKERVRKAKKVVRRRKKKKAKSNTKN